MVSHNKRGPKVEFFQGDPEDREKVLVPHVDVYRYYCWDDYSFDFTCTIHVASEWVCLGCDFSLVVSGVFLKYVLWSGAFKFMKISPFLGYPFHVISCSRFVDLSEGFCDVISFFLLTNRLC